MSTSLLYHGFGIHGYDYVRSRYEGGQVIFTIHQRRENLRCSVCRSRHVVRRGTIQRRFRSLPIGLKPVWITLAIQRVWCQSCNLIRQVYLGFADARFSYTKAFERYALELCGHMTILDVARHLGVSWDVIKDIQKRYLKKRFCCPKLKKLKRLAIDEITIGKGHRYLTIVLNLATGAVVFVGDGKGAEALEPFWKRLKRSKPKVEAIAIDMSPAYISSVTENLPQAAIVFDHFHIIKLYNDRLSQFRRQLYHQVIESRQKGVIKGTRWLLLKNPENLDAQRNEQQRLHQALELNQPLATVYYMKEDLRLLWSQTNQQAADSFLNDWTARAKASQIEMLEKFADTLIEHRHGILSYYRYPISTAPLEGTNNKIKTMKRQAYGFRDMEFFKLKIMGIHLTKYALVG
jgi:transposase